MININNIYIVKISKKHFSNILKYHIYANKIKEMADSYLLYLDYDNYQKILKFKKIYNIELKGYQGLIKYQEILKKHYLFFIMFFLGITLIIFLSNIIFKIDINTTNEEMKKIIIKELNKYQIELHKFVKTYEEKELIKKKILNSNKDKLEWLEITREGSKYTVSLEERIIENNEEDKTSRDIVASKNAIILSIEARDGSIVKKLNDYVHKGEVIVTGKITHKDEVVDLIRANAIIYGETWYNVHVSYPIAYYEKIETGNIKKRLSLMILNKKINFFDKEKYSEEEIIETKIFAHRFLPFKLSYEKVKEVTILDSVYTTEEAVEQAIKVARNKLLKSLPSDSKILNQKKLKIIVNNSTIDVDVFFKVYENITDTKEIVKEGE